MKILLVNDDGVDAPGLSVLRSVMEPWGEVVIVAPADERSACSHAITTQRPVSVQKIEERLYAVDGTPADCVRFGLARLLPDADLVVSGINPGANLGVDIHFSGTVAGAREAAMRGRPALAVSQYKIGELDWELTARRTGMGVAHVMELASCRGWFWNLNLPGTPDDGRDLAVVECPPDPTPVPHDYEEVPGGEWQYVADYHGRQRLPGHDVDICFRGFASLSRISCVP